MSITVIGPKQPTLLPALGGDETIFGLVTITASRGLFVVNTSPGQVEVKGITDVEQFTIEIVGLLASKGFDVLNYPAYFELTELQLTNAVPASFPNRTYTDVAEVEHVHTWETWGSDNGHEAVLIGAKWYKSSAASANLGQPIPTSCWIVSGLTVLTLPEFITLQPVLES